MFGEWPTNDFLMDSLCLGWSATAFLKDSICSGWAALQFLKDFLFIHNFDFIQNNALKLMGVRDLSLQPNKKLILLGY